MDVPIWVNIILMAGAVLTALYVIWNKFIHPIAKAVVHLEDSGPVLLAIAKEFERNGGTTLRDELDAVRQKLEDLEQRHANFEEYTHTRFHDLITYSMIIKEFVMLEPDQKDDYLDKRLKDMGDDLLGS